MTALSPRESLEKNIVNDVRNLDYAEGQLEMQLRYRIAADCAKRLVEADALVCDLDDNVFTAAWRNLRRAVRLIP